MNTKNLCICFLSLIFLAACGANSNDQSLSATSGPQQAAPIQEVANFNGPRSNYIVTKTDASTVVEDIIGADGRRVVSNATRLRFSNLSVDSSLVSEASSIPKEKLQAIIELYIAFFVRAPDADGLRYWIGQYKNGMSIEQIGNAFFQSAILFQSVTGYSASMTNKFFVYRIYVNVLGRYGENTPTAEEVDYWVRELANGKSKGYLVASMLYSAHSFRGDSKWGWVEQLLENRYKTSYKFAVEEGITFNNPEDAIRIGKDICYAVTPTSVETANMIAVQYWGNSRVKLSSRGAAEGYYEVGSPGGDYGLRQIILDDNSSWIFSFSKVSPIFSDTYELKNLLSFSFGHVRAQNNEITLTDQRIYGFSAYANLGERLYPVTNTVGRFTKGLNINIAESAASAPSIFNASINQPPLLNIDYDKPADVADIAGAWSTSVVGDWATLPNYISYGPLRDTADIYISSSGRFSVNPVNTDCYISGSITPRPSGKNIFDVRLSDPDEDCPNLFAGYSGFQTMTGIAFTFLTDTGSRRIAMAIRSQDGLRGNAFSSVSRISYGSPQISDVVFDKIAYREKATVTFEGKYLDQKLTFDVPACSALKEIGAVSLTKRVFECKLVRPGSSTVTVNNSFGTKIYQKEIVVPLAQTPMIQMVTTMGTVLIELDPVNAPNYVDEFLNDIESKLFERKFFYSVSKDWSVVAGGMNPSLKMENVNEYPNNLLTGSIYFSYVLDSSNAIVSRSRRALKRGDLWRLNDHTPIKDFRFQLGDSSYICETIFGRVISGLDVIDNISRVPVMNIDKEYVGRVVTDLPVKPVVILSMTRAQ